MEYDFNSLAFFRAFADPEECSRAIVQFGEIRDIYVSLEGNESKQRKWSAFVGELTALIRTPKCSFSTCTTI
jgi:hypothetical protein